MKPGLCRRDVGGEGRGCSHYGDQPPCDVYVAYQAAGDLLGRYGVKSLPIQEGVAEIAGRAVTEALESIGRQPSPQRKAGTDAD